MVATGWMRETVRALWGAAICACALWNVGCNSTDSNSASNGPQGDSTHSLRVVSPNGGESFKVGQPLPVHVKFKAADGYRLMLQMLILPDSARFDLNPDSQVVALNGDTVFTYPAIPAVVSKLVWNGDKAAMDTIQVNTANKKAKIKTWDYSDSDNIYDYSDGTFTIVP